MQGSRAIAEQSWAEQGSAKLNTINIQKFKEQGKELAKYECSYMKKERRRRRRRRRRREHTVPRPASCEPQVKNLLQDKLAMRHTKRQSRIHYTSIVSWLLKQFGEVNFVYDWACVVNFVHLRVCVKASFAQFLCKARLLTMGGAWRGFQNSHDSVGQEVSASWYMVSGGRANHRLRIWE